MARVEGRLTWQTHSCALSLRMNGAQWSRLGQAQGLALLWLLALFAAVPAHAGGPRFVTGKPYFSATAEGNPIGWKQSTLLYSTDPGPLSATVNHQAADALVAAAAAVWNVPVASITVAQGAPLAEDVSGQNVYLGSSGVVFPADVMSSNAVNVPLAVIYDADGAVTDTLLGSGASSPSSCRQNAVTETVDSFDPAGFILHAILIVDGRCTGPAPQQQLQLQYQLERGFGRVLGLAWSQANDNVYTGTPTPTAQQALNWPIMHPLDILCGAYTYQCLPQPFTLRPDDIASLVSVYPNPLNATPAAGKQVTLSHATSEYVPLSFPSGEGMAGVNILAQVRPYATQTIQPWITASAVSGYAFRRAGTSPFVPVDASPAGSFGTHDQSAMGTALLTYVPLDDVDLFTAVVLTTEPINPLYSGAYALGTNTLGTVAPSGSNLAPQWIWSAPGPPGLNAVTIADAAEACGSGADGTFSAPMAMPASGWWNGQICAYRHVSNVQAPLRAGRSLTVEVTALDADGLATTVKARPAIGIYAPEDAPGALPSVAVAAQAFQALTVGTTTLTAATAQQTSVTIAIADERGDGRPDFNYQARVFYADSISPALVPAAGARAVVTGLGFRPGNVVTVNGVGAVVTAWTENSITLKLPAMSVAHAASGIAVDVTVSDLGTGATTTMTGAVTYLTTQTPPPSLRVLTAPAGPLYTGAAAATPFTVQLLAADGVTPVVGEPLSLSLANAAGTSPGTWAACGTAVCTLLTDAKGQATSGVTPLQPGTLTLTAVDARNTAVTVSASVTVLEQAGLMVTVGAPTGTFYTTRPAGTFAVKVLSAAGTAMPGRSVRFSVLFGSAQVGACAASACTVVTDGNGIAQAELTPLSTGAVTVQASDGSLTQTVTINVLSWADTLSITSAPASGAIAGSWAGTLTVQLLHGDGVTPDTGESISFSGPPGVLFGRCGTNACSQTTDQSGAIQQQVLSQTPGTITLQMSFAGQVVTTTFTVLPDVPQLQLVSVPATPVPVGTVSATPFAVRMVDASGNPMAGQQILFNVPVNEAYLDACGPSARCYVFTAGDGTASTTLTPLVAGTIPLNATAASANLNATFTGLGALRTLTVIKQPGAAGAPLNQPQTIVIKVVQQDGVTPAAGETLDLAVLTGTLAITECATTRCRVNTDQNGLMTFTATPIAAGLITVEAVDEANPADTVTLSFMALAPPPPVLPDAMTVLSAPAGSSPVGQANAASFTVRIIGSDGVSPAPGRSVQFAVSAGQATLSACASAPCAVTTDANGIALTSVTPTAPGVITVTVTEDGVPANTAAASFTAVAVPVVPPPVPAQELTVVQSPGASVFAGMTAAAAFSVRLTLTDGVTPVSGVLVSFSQAASGGSGSVQFVSCGGAACTVLTDSSGLASTSVTGLQAGGLTLSAMAPAPAVGLPVPAVALTFQVVADQVSLVALEPAIFLAEGTPFGLQLTAIASENGSPAAGESVLWSATAGVALSDAQTVTAGDGSTSVLAAWAALAAHAQVTVTACAQFPAAGNACASFTATVVAGDQFAVAIASGGLQAISAAAAPGGYAPVIAQVTDGSGHPVAGASVTIYQTVTVQAFPCPASGRCPAAPVVAQQATTAVTGASGQVSVPPLTVGTPLSGVQQTQLAFAAGTQGFAMTVLTMTP